MASRRRLPVDLPGVDAAMAADIEERISDFEGNHEADVLSGGPGWVPRVTGRDYAIAIAVNALIVAWLVAVFARG